MQIARLEPRREKVEKVGKELDLAYKQLKALAPVLKDSYDKGIVDGIWLSYLRLEKAVTFLKLTENYEGYNQTREVKTVKDKDEAKEKIADTMRIIISSSSYLETNNFGEAIRVLSDARDKLRSVILWTRRLQTNRSRQ